jgi:large subunit ribosomal protein L9
MKVILTQTVPKVGKEGTVVTVANGFARNYLFPRRLATIADKTQVAALGRRNERIAAKTAGEKSSADSLRDKLQGKEVRIEGKVGKYQGKLFGAITSADIADAIKAQLGVTLEKKQIALIDPIKKLGTFSIELDLHREVDAVISVVVFDPNAPVEAAAHNEDEHEQELVEA